MPLVADWKLRGLSIFSTGNVDLFIALLGSADNVWLFGRVDHLSRMVSEFGDALKSQADLDLEVGKSAWMTTS